jgi:ParB-like chromosome segregation protein Spo0J
LSPKGKVLDLGAIWCILVYSRSIMTRNGAQTERVVRQSISIPPRVARRVRALAEKQKTSANRVLVDLIETGLQAKEAEKERFFALAEKLTQTKDMKERKRLREELAVMTFGS